jgi:hypothetical protein
MEKGTAISIKTLTLNQIKKVMPVVHDTMARKNKSTDAC